MNEFNSLAEFAVYAKERARLAELATARLDPMTRHGDREAWSRIYLHPEPNEVDCAYCRAMATCPAALAQVEKVVGAGFDVISEEPAAPADEVKEWAEPKLAIAMRAAGFLEDFIKAVRAETERRLLLGEPVKWGDGATEGYGLELGRAGARAWKDPKEVERMLREQFRMKIEDAYDLTLISPTSAEKLAKVAKPSAKNPEPAAPKLTIKRWEKLQELISRSEPKPSVKPLAIIKEPYSPTKPDEGGFDVVPDEDQLW